MSKAVPILPVRDARASADFYRKALEFEVDWEHRFAPGLPLFVSISRDNATLFLTEHPEAPRGSVVYLFVDDVDQLYNLASAAGADIPEPPQDQSYGVRDMTLFDLDRNQIRVGTRSTER